jgi:integrase
MVTITRTSAGRYAAVNGRGGTLEFGTGDVEDFTVSNMSGKQRLAPSTVRGYHLTLRMFCDYLTDVRYDWPRQCRDRFDQVPIQVCHEWNTVAHLNDYEGRPARRPFTYDELQVLFDYLDERVERVSGSGRKGALAALRDAQMIKTAYAFGLRRNELCRLDVADLRPNPHVREWGTYGSLHVRYGKAVRGGVPRRRTVLAVPEFDWAVAGLRQWVEQARPLFAVADHPALWVTERLTRVSLRYFDQRFAQLRAEVGLDKDLSLHCLRHSYVTHLVEFGYPERFVQVLLSPVVGVHDVQHETETMSGLRGGGGYLAPSITQIPRRFDAGSTGLDARLVA